MGDLRNRFDELTKMLVEANDIVYDLSQECDAAGHEGLVDALSQADRELGDIIAALNAEVKDAGDAL